METGHKEMPTLEAAVLRCCAGAPQWFDLFALRRMIGDVSADDLRKAADALEVRGYLASKVSSDDVRIWSITPLGLKQRTDLQSIAPSSVTISSATAFLCFSEDELDNWWAGLDVECKADAFAGFSLRAQGQEESFVAAEPRIPVAGTIGEGTHPQQKPEKRAAADQAVRQ
jgi:hypothetical protein